MPRLRSAYSELFAEYREAAEKLKAGERLVEFPEGCFPPGLPFVEPVSALAGELLSAEVAARSLPASASLVKQDTPLAGKTPLPPSPLAGSTEPNPAVVSVPPPGSVSIKAPAPSSGPRG